MRKKPAKSKPKSPQGGSETKKDPSYDKPDIETRFKAGNRFWEARSSAGPKPIFSDPNVLWEKCCEYFEWVHNNPLLELKAWHATGIVTKDIVPKVRIMTIESLCLFLDISIMTWDRYRDNPVLCEVVKTTEQIIREQKLQAAAADLVNPLIVARILKLADTKEVTGKDGKPIEHAIVDAPPAFKTIDEWVEWKKRNEETES